MKDHAAPKVVYTQGIKLDELNSAAPNTGVVTEALNDGIPHVPGHMDGGVPWHMPPPPKATPKVAVCEAETKTGEPCKARPLKGQAICIGHSRVKINGPSSDSE